ncbi:MAG: zinc ribbon domain-containing protein [Prevotella sp.]|nr:zinc ribbon domain-containing protein [Prevotella sp.]
MSKVKRIYILLSICCLLLLTGCYTHESRPLKAPEYSERQLDSLSFSSTRHYTFNYNFVVSADSVLLLRQQPEEQMSDLPTDSFIVKHNEELVVADIRVFSEENAEGVGGRDSVWVQLATRNSEFGWIQESELLPKVVPDDPISQFISTFSNVHTLISLIIVGLIMFFYFMRRVLRQNAHIVHFNDIDSFYPTLLALLVASAATLYASIQTFDPEMWRHFYFHPTLNPFNVPLLLSVFLVSVWAMLIVGLAAVDDIFHQLTIGEALLYLGGLLAVCAVNYIIFSITTLYFIGYLLLVFYIAFALRQYFRNSRCYYLCGSCGRKMHSKGRCPHCGALND